TRRQTPRLGAANHAGLAAPGSQAQLGQLRGLARAGLASDHHYLVLADQRDDVVAARADRQGGVQRDARLGRHASPTARRRALDVRSEGRELACVGFARKPAPALLQSVEIATGYGLELPAQGLQLRIRCIVRAGMFHRAANDTGPTK